MPVTARTLLARLALEPYALGMRIGAAAGAVVIAAGACGSAVATTRSQCGPSGAKTLAVDRVARVYATGGNVYGCADAGGHTYLLAANNSRPGQPHIGQVALAGIDVAYGKTTSGVDTATATVTVRRLDSGRTLRSLAAMSQPVGPESFQSVDSIVVKKDGAVAWIASAHSIVRNSSQIEVDRVDGRGRSTLDTNSGIDSISLRLHGSALSWTDSGQPQAGTLD
jgi:hypothetical protein